MDRAESPGDVTDIRARETRAAQRGFFVITGAKVWFLICGTALNIGLPRILGDPARFGDFGVVNTLISIVNMMVIAGAVQVMSKRVSEAPDVAAAIRRRGLQVMSVVGLFFCLSLALGAGWIAEHIFHDPNLVDLIRIASVIPLAYGFYAVIIGILNGLKRFTPQALFDIGFATMKLALIIGLVILGFGVPGAFIGFAAAALAIALASFFLTRKMVSQPAAPQADVKIVKFLVQVMFYTLFVNILVQGDVLALKAATFDPILAALSTSEGADRLAVLAGTLGLAPEGLAPALASESTAMLAGLYRATKNVSLISYQAVIAITFVIFPLVSRATFQSDGEATRAYIRQTLRTALLLVACIASLVAAGGKPLLIFLFGDVYGLAAPALYPMLGAMTAFSLLFVMGTILTAGGRPFDAMWIAGVAAAIQLTTLFVGLPVITPGAGVLAWAAVGTLAAIGLPLVLAGVVVRRRFRAPLPYLTLARAVVAGIACVLAAYPLPWQGLLGILIRVAVGGLVFLGVLIVSREIGKEELAMCKRLLSRRSGDS